MKKNTFYNSFLFCVSDNTFCLWKNNELCTQAELDGSDSGPRAFFIHSMNLNASSQRSVLVMDWQESTALLNFSLSPRFLLKFALIVSASIFPSRIYVHRVMIYAIILFVLKIVWIAIGNEMAKWTYATGFFINAGGQTLCGWWYFVTSECLNIVIGHFFLLLTLFEHFHSVFGCVCLFMKGEIIN